MTDTHFQEFSNAFRQADIDKNTPANIGANAFLGVRGSSWNYLIYEPAIQQEIMKLEAEEAGVDVRYHGNYKPLPGSAHLQNRAGCYNDKRDSAQSPEKGRPARQFSASLDAAAGKLEKCRKK